MGDFVDMEKAKEKAREDAEEAEARLATLRGELGAYRRASREAEEDMRNAEERAKAMRDAVVADEQHEQD